MNGAKNITIRRTTVGPSGKTPLLANFSGARFIGLWFMFIWKKYWTADEKDVLLKQNLMTFRYQVLWSVVEIEIEIGFWLLTAVAWWI